jgi:iron complex outermembrane receptor protein
VITPTIANVAVTNAAKVKSQGIETDFAILATDNLTFDGSIAYIQTEYDEYNEAPCAFAIPGNPPQVSPPGCTQQPGGAFSQNLSGETLDNAPEVTGNVGAEYRMPIDSFEWFARADATYRDDTLQDINLAPTSEQDSFTLYSLRMGLTSPEQGWTVTVWGNNLGDEEYSIDSIVNNFGTTRIQGPTRMYGVTADYVF